MPWQTVCWYFNRREDGNLTERMLTVLRRRVRAAHGGNEEPSSNRSPPPGVCVRVMLQPTATDRTPIIGELTMTYAEYRRIVLAPRAASLWVLRFLGTITLLWLAQMVAMGAASGSIALAIVIGLALPVGHEVVVLLEWQRYRRLAALGPFRYEVASSGLRVATAQIELTVAWSGISRVHAYRPCWVFWVSIGDRPLPVSRAAFSAESQAAVDELLRDLTR